MLNYSINIYFVLVVIIKISDLYKTYINNKSS
jgi:hypothetical protein